MKKHILWLIIGLALLALGVLGLKRCDEKVTMPLIGGEAQQSEQPQSEAAETETPQAPDTTDAAAVDELISKIAAPVTLESKAAIEAARAAYGKLADGAKAEVTKLAELEAAEAALAKLQSEPETTDSKPADGAADKAYAVADTVTFNGTSVYYSSKAESAAAYVEGPSVCEITLYAAGAAHPYHLVSQDGGGVYGWVDAASVKAN